MNQLIDRRAIELMVPHRGKMCLLDAVLRWTFGEIVCEGGCNDPQHPLMHEQKLPTTAAIEYAAQATAVHGALLDPDKRARPGVLAKLTDISLYTDFIQKEEHPLNVSATLLSRSESGCLYRFTVKGTRNVLASGELMVAFPASLKI